MLFQNRQIDLETELGNFNEIYTEQGTANSYYSADRFTEEIDVSRGDLSLIHINTRYF